MDENFIVDLPPEANDTDFFVTAPSGGLQAAVSLLIGGLTDYVDLDIQSGHRHGRFRVQPGDNITQESTNPYRYEISNDRPGYFLDQHGLIRSGPISFSGKLWTEVQTEGTITGVLRLWKQECPERPDLQQAS